MLTKGIIQQIDASSNKCIVRMPIFEIAGNEYTNEAEATLSIPPGMFGGFKVNDVVIVGFEDNLAGKPIILGKLYLGALEESETNRGAIQCDTLLVEKSATLPADTKILFDKPNFISNSEVELQSYNSLSDITSAITKNSKRILTLEQNKNESGTKTVESYTEDEQEVGTWFNKKLYRKTIRYNFIDSGVGQDKNADWNIEIDTHITTLERIRLLYDFTYLETTAGTIDAAPVSSQNTSYETDTHSLVIESQNNLFSANVNLDTKKIYASGKTLDYTLKLGYFTIEYIKQ